MIRDLRNPLQRARGLGSAKDGVGHWWTQRLTAIALVVLVLWFVVLVLGLLGHDYQAVRASIARPWNALLMIAFIIAAFWHSVLGLQVVIEDYVHTRWLEVTSMIVIKLLAFAGVLAGVLAVLRIALGS
ncbi:MAG TPA: succinate dehydrogenase, hydrophobic membrane anchor protein [Pinirhizobacter sp.]|uniref:succinate dehydrogenase, hydrophobic membrane anchor protein n=1 Tax=Pinirhizobacter sp. TaxID=2950432 RepID=UPI002BCCB155|nr:succinate dehydrogenase, hydrophobic membrane anchor protein [Pinirhizobacter sp.]HMH67055.1 succinate dehydrogenase, hydrophobic membrane anchor protein [Pinirhizobacter sp.]